MPIIIDKENVVVAGHTRLLAAKKLGLETAPCVVADDLTPAQIKAFRIADNKTAEFAEWDDEMLRIEMEGLDDLNFNLDLTGFDKEDLDALFAKTDKSEVTEDEFDVDKALEEKPFVKQGDLWLLGRHRLLCGDATKPEDVTTLMDGKKANLSVTDPPYNCSYEGGSGMKIMNDSMDGKAFYAFLLSSFKNIYDNLADGGAVYIFHSDAEKVNFYNATVDAGFHYSSTCIWVKNSLVLGRMDYQMRHEPVIYAFKNTSKHRWYSDRKQTTVWEFDRPTKSKLHPTIFSGQLISLNSSQKFDLGSVFGWVHKDTGRRRYKKVFDMQGRGNAKSVKLSGIADYFMCSDCFYPPGHPEDRIYELSPEVDCVAVDRQQAKIVWQDAVTMGQASPDISKRLKFMNSVVKHKTRGGMLRPLSKDTKNKNGVAPCLYEIDEYHEHPTSFMYDVGQSSMGKRAQSLMYVITTAGNNAENSPCKKEYDICCKILDGLITAEDYFIIIRQYDRGDNPHDFSLLPKANPMLQEPTEYSEILLQEIKSEHDLAYGSGDPAKIREWLIKRCDLWQEGSTDKYIDGCMDKWKAAAVSREEFAVLTKGLPCLVGVDLSKRIDLTGQAFLFKLLDGRYALKAHGFIPEAAVTKHEHSDRVPYRDWISKGYCTATEGEVVDYDYLIERVHQEEFDNNIKVLEWDLDGALATQLENTLEKQGYNVVEIRQNIMTLSGPTKLFRELTIQGKLIHEENPLFDWCVSNACQYSDTNENIRLTKKNKDDSQRIDLLAAAIDCLARVTVLDEPLDISDKILSDDFGF